MCDAQCRGCGVIGAQRCDCCASGPLLDAWRAAPDAGRALALDRSHLQSHLSSATASATVRDEVSLITATARWKKAERARHQMPLALKPNLQRWGESKSEPSRPSERGREERPEQRKREGKMHQACYQSCADST
eukprot:3884264-Rhodomonas_salina.1